MVTKTAKQNMQAYDGQRKRGRFQQKIVKPEAQVGRDRWCELFKQFL